MNLLKQIPNLITLGNLACGCMAVFYTSNNELVLAAYLVATGIFLDFFDGFFARILGVSGEFGKQLDSLADMVTSGVAPGMLLFQLLSPQQFDGFLADYQFLIPYVGLLFTLGAACRLAKFNIDERQSDSFIGVPTPAATIFVMSIPLILQNESSESVQQLITSGWFLIGTTVAFTYLMNAELPLFALKFKNYSWKDNSLRYIFLAISIAIMALLKFTGIPLVILLYVLLSLITRAFKK